MAEILSAPPLDLTRPRTLHIVGVGGVGMSAIALLLVRMGHHVSGSDIKESVVLARLEAAGVRVMVGNRAENVPAGADAVVYSTAIPERNVELTAARELGVTVLHRSAALAALAATRRTIAVAGSHGKTTTSSMLALILRGAGWQPSFVIGGEVNEVGADAAFGEGEWLVIEADESDGTFLRLGPEAAIVTSIEPDHLDYYGGFGPLVAAFEKFVDGVPGPIVACADDEVAARIAAARPRIRTYGRSAGASYRIVDARIADNAERFTLVADDETLGELVVPLAVHAATNATGAAALALELGVPFDAIATALRGFGGVARRFERRGELDGVTFVDDYAHLPSEVSAAIATARRGGWRRVVAVFQPHRYTRTAALWQDFAGVFDEADAVVLTDVYAAGETPIAGISGRLVVHAVVDASPGLPVAYLPRHADLVDVPRRFAHPGDVVLTLGAGDLTTMPDTWLARGTAMNTKPSGLVDLGDALESRLPGRVRRAASSAELTTYRCGGPLAVLVRAEREADLAVVADVLRGTDTPVLVVGRGSNLLVADAGFAGIAITLVGELEQLDIDRGSARVRAGGGVPLPVLARRSAAVGVGGLEFFVGIPGSVGGAVRMNAGGHGADTAAVVVTARVFDLGSGSARDLRAAELGLGYRHSALPARSVVVGAVFAGEPDDPAACTERIAEIVRWRREHQPGGQNAGSVFTNPPDDAAGRLIEAAGCKGLRVGGAVVSEKHANFFVADPGAAAADVFTLVELVQERVEAATGVHLEPELRCIGFAESR